MRKFKLWKTICLACVLCAVEAVASPEQTFRMLINFDGAGPIVGLMQGLDGNLYGTTVVGGANCSPDGCGTVFQVSSGGKLARLYSFCAQAGCTDGSYPYAALALATNGNFYGTTNAGGAYGYSTIFEITPQGKLTTLYSFCAQTGCTDGSYPYASLVQGTDGNFYGTTYFGGTSNVGTVFKITPSGKLTTLHSFSRPDGLYPYAGLVQATDGNFYGTTEAGYNSDGMVFKSPQGAC